MYGLVNKGLKGFILQEYGELAWDKVCSRTGLVQKVFVTMEAYDDALTYDLVGAAVEELGVSPQSLLERFGEYWILYTAEEGYGELLEAGGGRTCESSCAI